MGMELSKAQWRLAFSQGEKLRQRSLPAGDIQALAEEIAQAKHKFALAADCVVRACYETGRDGFWIHRLLTKLGVQNLVVDAASIEVARRARNAKTDRLDAEKLVRKLMAYWGGERSVWRVVQVPSPADEDRRRPQRESQRLKQERTAHRARILSLLALHGVKARLNAAQQLPAAVNQLRDWDGQSLPPQLTAELERELARLALVHEQLRALDKAQATALKQPLTAAEQMAVKLMRLRGVGEVGGLLLAGEFFAWRGFRNRREVGALAGLCGTPYCSGQSRRDQGISKAGNKRVRWVMIELAWNWLRFQSGSGLAQWFWQRFGQGNARQRRVGIVALARKLLVALWKYLERDELPVGAVLKAAA
jgi:transposase